MSFNLANFYFNFFSCSILINFYIFFKNHASHSQDTPSKLMKEKLNTPRRGGKNVFPTVKMFHSLQIVIECHHWYNLHPATVEGNTGEIW